MNPDERYMHRCFELAGRGSGYVAPNPMVGAVLVHDGKIIGEGWHQRIGEAHAEVNCIHQAIANGHGGIIPDSVLYVSLEPCSHFGKTPPCTDFIIDHKIRKVVIGCRDPFPEVDGKGIERLRAAGIETVVGINEKEAMELNRRFLVFHTRHRPYIILKWAQTSDGFIGTGTGERLLISNEQTNHLVHQWRSEEASILAGTNTVLLDDPELTNRYWPLRPSPVRLVVDTALRLPLSMKVFNDAAHTIIFNTKIHSGDAEGHPQYIELSREQPLIPQVLKSLYQLNILSVLVEGGRTLLQSFIDAGAWDETRKITNSQLAIGNGVKAPVLPPVVKTGAIKSSTDLVEFFRPSTMLP